MKTTLILGSFLAFVTIGNSQIYTPSGVIQGSSGNNNVGIGIANPAFKLELTSAAVNDGLKINQTGFGGAVLHLNNQTAGGRDWSIFSSGNGNTQGSGHFFLLDWNTGNVPLFINGTTNDIGMGTITPSAKLHVIGTTFGVRGDAGSNVNNTGVQGNGYYGVDGTGVLVGTRGNCFTAGGAVNQGVRGTASGGVSNIAGYFGAGGAAGVVSYGVYCSVANPMSGGTNYGIYASVSGNNNLGLGPNYAGYFNGDVVTAGGSYFYSDGRIKKNITSINSSLSIIEKLNPVNYSFDAEGNKNLAVPTEKQFGFISQEVQKILPEFTKTLIHPATFDEFGHETSPKKEILGLNYIGFIAILTKGIQEQQQQIADQSQVNNDLRAQLADQQKQLDEQKQLIDALSQKVSGTTGVNSINTVETGFQMSQNEPNPFTHETVVKYTLPQTVSNAFMAVYDLTGKQITTFPIEQKGASSLTITSEKLAAGIYIYSIVADGKVMDSKRMIVSEK
jgi:hypothetical protein